jgi:hypothetical protein
MTRAEHVAWAKARALEYVEAGEYDMAMASMMSNLNKHPEIDGVAALQWGKDVVGPLLAGDWAAVRAAIEDYQ